MHFTGQAAQDFVKAVSSFNLDTAFPNMEAHAYDWRVDKYEPNRVWFTIRNTGTHTGPLKFLGRTIQPTGKVRAERTALFSCAPLVTVQAHTAGLYKRTCARLLLVPDWKGNTALF